MESDPRSSDSAPESPDAAASSQRDPGPAETPEIFALHVEGPQPGFSRRSFLEMASVAASAAMLTFGGGCVSHAPPVKPRYPRAHRGTVTALAIDGSGRLLASGDAEGAVKLWQLPDGGLLGEIWKGGGMVMDLHFAGDGKVLWVELEHQAPARLQMPKGNVLSGAGSEAFSWMNALVALPSNGTWIAGTNARDGIAVCDSATGSRVLTIPPDGAGRIERLAASADGRWLVSVNLFGLLSVWAPGSKPAAAAARSELKEVPRIALSDDGSLIVLAQSSGSLQLVSCPGLATVKETVAVGSRNHGVVIRKQKDLVAIASGTDDVLLWQVSSRRGKIRELKGHVAPVRCVAVTPDGKLLASGSEDESIRLWSLPKGALLRTLVDLSLNTDEIKGANVNGVDVYGRTITYTLPCGSPIPAGATCVCNCVPGTMPVPAGHSQTYNTVGYCTCNTICTCNTVCTCQSVGGRYISYWYPN